MHQITAYADDHNLVLILRARRFGNPRGLDNDSLVEFYKKFGFVVESMDSDLVGTYMTRQIGAKETIDHVKQEALEEGAARSRKGF